MFVFFPVFFGFAFMAHVFAVSDSSVNGEAQAVTVTFVPVKKCCARHFDALQKEKRKPCEY